MWKSDQIPWKRVLKLLQVPERKNEIHVAFNSLGSIFMRALPPKHWSYWEHLPAVHLPFSFQTRPDAPVDPYLDKRLELHPRRLPVVQHGNSQEDHRSLWMVQDILFRNEWTKTIQRISLIFWTWIVILTDEFSSDENQNLQFASRFKISLYFY